jgi:hypothetical protein
MENSCSVLEAERLAPKTSETNRNIQRNGDIDCASKYLLILPPSMLCALPHNTTSTFTSVYSQLFLLPTFFTCLHYPYQ